MQGFISVACPSPVACPPIIVTVEGCAPLAEWFVLGPCVVSLEESPSSSPSRPAKLCISFVGVK